MLRTTTACASIMALLVSVACSSDDSDGAPSSIVRASPPAGAYPSDVTVTISAPAGAVVHYTSDGSAPQPFGQGTTSEPAPVDIPLTVQDGEQIVRVLRFVATDADGNVLAAEQSLEYRIDERDPSITAEASIPDVALLAEADVTWSVDEPVDWVLRIGQDADIAELAGSTSAADEAVTVAVPGAALPAQAEDVPLTLTVTDAVGRTSEQAWTLSQQPWVEVAVQAEFTEFDLSSDGERAYLAGTTRWLAIDLASETVVQNVPLTQAAEAQVVVGEDAYVAAGQVLRIDGTTGVIENTIATDGRATALAREPDGSRVWYSDFAGTIGWIDPADDTLTPVATRGLSTRTNMHFLSEPRLLVYQWRSQASGMDTEVRTFDVEDEEFATPGLPSERFDVPFDPSADWVYLREPELAGSPFLAVHELDGEPLVRVDLLRSRVSAPAPERILLTAEPSTSVLEVRTAEQLEVDIAYPLGFGPQGDAEAMEVDVHDGSAFLFWLGVDRVLRVIPLL